jgi:hypothetical protein
MARMKWALLCVTALGCSANEVPIATWKLESGGADLGSVTLPADIGSRVAHAPRYTLESTVELPPHLRSGALSFGFAYLAGRAQVVADGEPAIVLGEGAGVIAKGWRLVRGDGRARIQIRIDVENSSFYATQLRSIPVLAADAQGPPSYRRSRFLNVASAGIAATIIAILIVIYGIAFLLERRREYSYFIIMALAALPALLGNLGYMYELFGHSFVAVIFLSSGIGSLTTVCFVHATFRLGTPPRIFRYLLIPLFAAVLITRDPIRGGQVQALLTLVTLALPTALYNIVQVVRVVLRPRADQDRSSAAIQLSGWILLAASVALESISIAGQPVFIAAASEGVTLYGIATALVLGRERVLRLREVQRLNDELRRQIAERSRELSEALAQLGSTPRAPALQPGEVVDERYRVLRALGKGGMGEVHEIERISDGRRLAIKVLSGVVNRDALARFAREAQIAAALDHPNVVAAQDVGVTASGTLFYVMELVSGGTLADESKRYGDPRWAIPVLRQIAAALSAMHARGIVHRDLKPSNVLLNSEQAKVTDFGIASLADSLPTGAGDSTVSLGARSGLTRTGAFMGTPRFMAPELVNGARDVLPSADLWSFGVIAYELLTGSAPFAEPPVLARLNGRMPATPARLPQLDGDLHTFIRRCLDEDPRARPTAAAFADCV